MFAELTLLNKLTKDNRQALAHRAGLRQSEQQDVVLSSQMLGSTGQTLNLQLELGDSGTFCTGGVIHLALDRVLVDGGDELLGHARIADLR